MLCAPLVNTLGVLVRVQTAPLVNTKVVLVLVRVRAAPLVNTLWLVLVRV